MAQHLKDFVYRIPPPERSRPPGTNMQVLALGLPRSGTDSLRTALLTLGYNRVWHGFELPLTRANDCVLWVPLLRSAAEHDRSPARIYDWDILLGDCDVVMDMPPCIFAEELLDFYPDAKVVLNRRSDMVVWHKSLNEAAEAVLGSGVFWFLSWFDAQMRWWYESAVLSLGIMSKGPGGFKQNGLKWGIDYYERLETKMQNEGREYLDWDVKDGWTPLCKFLGKEIPDEEFPWTNKSGDEFKAKADRAGEKMVRRSMMRIAATVVVVAGSIAWFAYARN
ncbi:hypothetical protein H2200_005045 [Cladophialophora chaetospira]|uniref:P-loop containing nucleoside triphosphate hydrolase protein n=1 Tax=Cladophialophora chaetospira TaxID=386627 RepID=A0AA38XB79_9EURO|nr:hypothetical protein H2200_005045 [Cladophialophora chaetospira]